jgi:excisionase family DNA binding protein
VAVVRAPFVVVGVANAGWLARAARRELAEVRRDGGLVPPIALGLVADLEELAAEARLMFVSKRTSSEHASAYLPTSETDEKGHEQSCGGAMFASETLGTEEVAVLLGVGVRAVQLLAKRGTLTARPGRPLRFEAAEVQRYLSTRKSA